jgi:hypothetical protein
MTERTFAPREIAPSIPDDDKTREQLIAERNQWVRDSLAMLEIVEGVEELYDMGEVGEISDAVRVRWLHAYNELMSTFGAWRRFGEAGIPANWLVQPTPEDLARQAEQAAIDAETDIAF